MKTRYELLDAIIATIAMTTVLAFICALVYAAALAKAGMI